MDNNHVRIDRGTLRGLVLSLLLVAAGLFAQPVVGAEPEVKVVYHADFADPRRFSAMLTSIHNMMKTYEDDLVEADVRIVFVAHGIRFLTDDPLKGTAFAEDQALQARRENLKGRLLSLVEIKGVKLELCGITQKEAGVPQETLYPGVTLVRSGVVRIAELQHKGYAYLKVE